MAIATVNPTTGVTERTFAAHNPAEVERRLATAADTASFLRTTTLAQRAEWMIASAELLEFEVETIARILTTEMGKTLASARAEALKCAKNMHFCTANAEGFLADEFLEDPSSVGATGARAIYQPLGIVLAVMLWHYPLWQVIRFAAPALMAANVGLLKYASNVSQAALYLNTLFTRGGFPEGAFSTLLIGSAEVKAVIEDKRVVAVTLTGSECY